MSERLPNLTVRLLLTVNGEHYQINRQEVCDKIGVEEIELALDSAVKQCIGLYEIEKDANSLPYGN